jgi:hypothetical protein
MHASRIALTAGLAGAVILSLLSCTEPGSNVDSAVLVGAGDIGECGGGSELTARIIDTVPGTVFTLGDNAYSSGTESEFANCYDPTWGRFKNRTRPAPGNHDHVTSGAAAYFAYFGANAGKPGEGWYAYDAGAWRVLVLNSEVDAAKGSAQETWLRAQLASTSTPCVLAYWHRPRFTSGVHGDDAVSAPFWDALYEANADVVLGGHDHDYERFALMNPQRQQDPTRGIRQFVVGTGGAGHYRFENGVTANSEARVEDRYGVLRLVLGPGTYQWQFIAAVGEGTQVMDSGTGVCH